MILPTGQWQSGTIGTRVRRELDLIIRRRIHQLMHNWSVMRTNGIRVSSLYNDCL